MTVSRRQFLQGASACAVAAAVPLPALAEMRPVMWSRNVTPPIFEGSIGTYQGVILRRGIDWVSLQPWGLVTSTVLEGIEADNGC